MKIVLISPKGPLYRHRTGIFKKSLRTAPLTLTTLAALVPKELNAEIEILDEGVIDIPDTIQADLVGLTVITGNAPRSYEIAQKIRSSGIPVILGGPHVTLCPDEAQKYGDSIVTGYAEKSWPQLLRDFNLDKLKSRYDMVNDFTLSNENDLPYPKRDLLRKLGYKSIHTFEATRGCIHNCNFCVVPTAWGRKPFQKPITHVIKDIIQMKSKHLVFYDLNLLADFKYAENLFTALIPLKVKWFGLSTTLIYKNTKLLNLLEKSGCAGLLIGFESLNLNGISAMNKKFNQPEDFRPLVFELHKRGIAVNGTFVFGSDNDDKDSFEQVRDFIVETKMDLPRFSILTPFPGTPLFKELEDQGRITTKDWEKYDGQHIVFSPKNISSSELLIKHDDLWKQTYSINGIMKRFRYNNRGLPLRLAANIGYRYYANRLNKFYTCMGGSA